MSADPVVFTLVDGRLSVLLARRLEAPQRGVFALPGGFVGADESPEETAERKLREKTGVGSVHLEQLRTYADPGRDPRGWLPSIAYLALVRPETLANRSMLHLLVRVQVFAHAEAVTGNTVGDLDTTDHSALCGRDFTRRAHCRVCRRVRGTTAAVGASAERGRRAASRRDGWRELSVLVPRQSLARLFAGGKLKRIEIKGGAPQTLADALQPHGGTWTTDGAIVFTPHQLSPLLRIAAGGGEPVAVTKLSPGHLGHLFPQALPDGLHILYFVSGASDLRGIYFGRLDGTAGQRLMDALSPALYVPTGHLLFVREQALFAQAFDPARIELEGSAVRVADRLAVGSGVAASEPAAMSASNAGDILYRSVAGDTRRQLTWLDRTGRTVAQVGGSDAARTRTGVAISLSPEGRRVAVARVTDGKTDLWLVDLERTGTMSRFTFSGDNSLGLWSRDGLRLTFGSTRNGRLDLYQRAIGGDRDEPLLVTPQHKAPVDWSPDGGVLLYLNAEPATHLDVWALPAGEKPFPLIRSPYEDLNPQFSPDGAWVAYQSDVSTRHEVYVRPFRGTGEAVLISTAGGTQPRWRRDGRELFYLGLDRRLMAVPIVLSSSGRPVEAGIPVPLFQTRIGGPGLAQREYEVSPDGQRFLLDAPVEEASAPIVLIQNWRP